MPMEALEIEAAEDGLRDPRLRSAGESAQKQAAHRTMPLFVVGGIVVVITIVGIALRIKQSKGDSVPVSGELYKVGRLAFEDFDTDDNGLVDADELGTVLEMLGRYEPLSKRQVWVEHYSHGQTAGLNLNQFLKLLNNLEVAGTEADTRAVFDMLDTDNDGNVSTSSFLRAVSDLGLQGSAADIQDLIRVKVGQDHYKIMDYPHFQALLKETEESSEAAAQDVMKVIASLLVVVFFKRGLRKGGITIVDAGSSGCKLFSFSDFAHMDQLKVTTKCKSKDKHEKGLVLKGIAALSYPPEDCRAMAKTKFVRSSGANDFGLGLAGTSLHLTNAAEIDLFGPYILGTLRAVHGHNSHCAKDVEGYCLRANNRMKVPILATAGMRLIPKEANDIVWNHICGKEDASREYRFAPKGSQCGTIPGTVEAYFEFLGNVASGKSRTLTGTFTIGGASAQIAIPFRREPEVRAFKQTIEKIKAKLGDCSELKLPGEDTRIPIFSINDKTGEAKECYHDFITIKTRKEINLPLQDIHVGGLDEVIAVGLVSFLGLEKHLVAGGVNQIEEWAKKTVTDETNQNCGAKKGSDPPNEEYDFQGCKEKLQKALDDDWVFGPVKQFFDDTKLSIEHFSYNTPAAIPSFQFGAGGEGDRDEETISDLIRTHEQEDSHVRWTAGETLIEQVQNRCEGPLHNQRFGFGKEKTCMTALYTALYLTSFFHSSIKQEEAQQKRLHFTIVDWSTGLYHNQLGAKTRATSKSRLLRAEDGPLANLLDTPLRHHRDSVMHGAAIHFTAGTGVMP